MKKFPISIRPFGIHAVLIDWPPEINENILDDILQFRVYLQTKVIPEEWEMVPAYNSLTLIREREPIVFEDFLPQLNSWYGDDREKSDIAQRYLWKLPVCYEPDFGIDLLDVSQKLNLTIPEIIARHTQNPYTVYGIGFLPGFMYLGGLPKTLEIPRKESPRLKVEKGAVGIASKQTGIYPQESPGGWNIIGNCPITLFNAENKNPCFVNVGDKIQFYAISRAEYDLHKIESDIGIYKLEKIQLDA